MDPDGRSLRFPRTRGDGPSGGRALDKLGFPRTRGDGPPRSGFSDTLSPARAGMDPVAPAGHRQGAGFPRTRGDGPPLSARTWNRSPLPPHARGWTGKEDEDGKGDAASPARAGMDPSLLGPHRGRWKLPPHARGWTRADRAPCRRPERLPPHARGWTLRWRVVIVRGVGASPARAGMDPPSPRQPHRAGSGFPPHARGWTVHAGRHAVGDGASPARAGMDPVPPDRDAGDVGFPRTRGDGPPPVWAAPKSYRLPPHARGWTVQARPAYARVVASPARAGMDPTVVCSTES